MVATPRSPPVHAKNCAFTLAIRSGVVLTLPLILRIGKGTKKKYYFQTIYIISAKFRLILNKIEQLYSRTDALKY